MFFRFVHIRFVGTDQAPKIDSLLYQRDFLFGKKRDHVSFLLFIFRIVGQVFPFIWILLVPVELLASVKVADITPMLAAQGVVASPPCGDGGTFGRRRRILQLRHQARTVHIIGGLQAGQFGQCSVNIDQRNRLGARTALCGVFFPPVINDKGHTGSFLPQGKFLETAFFTQVKSMIGPHHHDSIICVGALLKGIQNTAYVVIGP